MRAPVLHEPRTPMTIEDVELLPPRTGEVRVRMVASGVCHSCLHVIDGSFTGAAMPMILGDEGAGIVEEVGPEVTRVRVGDHIIVSWAPTCGRCHPCLRGRPAICENQPPFGYLEDGTVRFRMDGRDVYHYGPASYASEIILPQHMAVPIRKDMPLEEAALIGCSVTTGIGSVAYTARVPAGASLAIFGCGGVGLNAIQGGRLVSAHPIIAVDVVASKLEHAKAMGADFTIDSRADDAVEAIRELTGGRGVEYAIIAVGNGQAARQAWDSLANGGTAVMLGLMPSGEDLSIDPIRFIGHECRLIGSRYGSAVPADDFPRLVELYLAGKIRIGELITKRYGLDEINEAHRALADGEMARGLIVY